MINFKGDLRMNNAQLFLAYAQAFEETYVDDDWTRLEQFFSPDAAYLPGDGKGICGRDQFFNYLKNNLDTFDRLFDNREVELVFQTCCYFKSSHYSMGCHL